MTAITVHDPRTDPIEYWRANRERIWRFICAPSPRDAAAAEKYRREVWDKLPPW